MRSVFAFILFSFCVAVAQAKDLGVRGIVYPVIEKNLLSMIHQRLADMQKSGELAEINQEIVSIAKEKISRPDGVIGITGATKNKEWIFDPSWTVSKDIFDHKGQLVASKGQVVNPLSLVSLSEVLVFVNSDSKKEIEYIKNVVLPNQEHLKIILVNGGVVEAVEMLNMPVYFDQKGVLVNRFGIEHTPAIVLQKDNVLQVQEVAI